MTKIKSIEMQNVKGNTLVQNLSGKDIFIGLNGAGKTARISALMGSVLGYIPGQDKKESSTFELSSGSQMAMGVTLDNEFKFTRSFKQNDKGGISQDINLFPANMEKTNKEKNARIMDEVSNFPIMLDFEQFISMTDTQKRRFIYELSKEGNGWDKEKVRKYIEKSLFTEDVDEELFYSILDAINEMLNNDDIVDEAYIENMIIKSKEQNTYWKNEVKRITSTVQKLNETKKQLTVTDRDLVKDTKQLDIFQENLIEDEKKLTTQENVQKIKKNLEEKISKITKEISDLENSKSPHDIKSIEKNILEENKKIIFAEEIEADEKNIESINKKIKEEKKNLENNQKGLDDVKEQGIKKGAEIEARTEILNKVKTQKTCCVIDSRIPCKNDFSSFIKEETDDIELLKKEINDLKEKWKEQNNLLLDSQKKIKKLEEEKEKTFIILQNKQKKNSKAREQLLILQKNLEKAKSFDETKKVSIKTKTKELKDTQDELKNISTKITDLPLKETIKKTKDEINRLKNVIKEKEKAKQIIIQIKEAQMELKKAELNNSAYKLLVDTLGPKGLQGEIVKSILEPIREKIEENLSLMGNDNKFYFSTKNPYGQEVFQFGWEDAKGRKINFNTLSTGQQLQLMIALLVSFIEKANPKCKIIAVDNCNNLDKINVCSVLNGLNKLYQQGKVDNIILAGVIDKDIIPKDLDFTIWNLSEI